jgi:FKBP-type peptidyl-prolyl cis-trans isomerase
MTSQTSANGLQYEDTVLGSGKEATGLGQTAIVHYTGWLSDGTQFDSSKGGSQAFSFPIACGMVIKGWDEGIIGMKEGGTRKLTIPPELAYGAAGAAPVIPANATLIFEIELIEISE